MRLARNPLGVVTRKSVELWQKPAWSCDEKIGGVVSRNPLGVVTRNPLEVVARKPHGIVARNRLELWKIFDKIRPVGWITLTRFLFNRNIFPLTS